MLAKYMQGKLAFTLFVILLAFLALIARVISIVRENNQDYTRIVLSQRQASFDSRTIPSRRGDIMDRNGTVLATSLHVYTLILDPKMITVSAGSDPNEMPYLDPTVSALSEYFGFNADTLREGILNHKNSAYYRYRENGSAKEVDYQQKTDFEAKVKELNAGYLRSADSEENAKKVQGIWFEDKYERTYPYKNLACHVIGFANGDGTGGTGGVEQYYNATLTGVNGREYGYLDSDTNLQAVVREPRDGENLVTTIDTNIQKAAEKYLQEWQNGGIGSKAAAAVVMDPRNGEILALAGTNSFDLNNPTDVSGYTEPELIELGKQEALIKYHREHPDQTIKSEDAMKYFSYDQILDLGKQAAYNELWRSIPVSDTYEPGSTAKTFTLAGALEEGAITKDTIFNCNGYVELSDGIHTWKIRCHNHDGHGPLDAEKGLAYSCNVYLMQTAFAEGAENFSKYQKIFGLGGMTGIDLPAEADTSDLVYPADQLGKTALATNSFGQNFNVTMIQMAAGYASVINGGSYYRPHVVKQILNSNGTVVEDVKPELLRTTVSKSTSDFLKEALYDTVEEGTGTKAKIQGYHVGGKTGTAEKLPRSAKNYLVSFMGFAPVEDPQVLVYVIVDQPNLEGEAQASASFAIGIEQKIMNDALQFLNIPPSSETDPNASVNANLTEESEGIGNETLGEKSETSEAEKTKEETGTGESESSTEQPETDAAGNPITRSSIAPETDEQLNGDGEDYPELPPESAEETAGVSQSVNP